MTQPPGPPGYPSPGSSYGPSAPAYGAEASPYGPPPTGSPYGPPSVGPSPYGTAPAGAASYGHPYGNPYETTPYVPPTPSGPQHAGPLAQAPAYGYPYGPPPSRARITEPTLGWVLLGTGVLAFIGAVLPWATVGMISVAGTDGDGSLTLFFGLVIAAMGLVIGLRNGRLWAAILAAVFSGFLVLTAVVDIANISSFSSRFDGLDITVHVGGGLWLTLVGGVGSLVCSILAIVKRRPLA